MATAHKGLAENVPDAQSPIVDTQRGALIVNGLDPSSLTLEYLDELETSGVTCWVNAGGNLDTFAAIAEFCEQHSDRIQIARTADDIRTAYSQGKIAYVSPWQDANVLIADGMGYLPRIGNLRAYHELGLRICGIAYNVANSFGGGCLEPHIGLTKLGYQLVEKIHSLGILLDVGGHTGEQASMDAIAISGGVPVVCTHTNLKALNDNPRCTSDAVLEAIAGTGGVIGVCAFNDFHARTHRDVHIPSTPQVDLDRHLDQYDYLKKLVGVDHIGLGPDFVQGRGFTGLVSDAERSLVPPESYSPCRPWLYVKGFERISQLSNVTQGLMARGWSDSDLRKLLGENWLRVYERVWRARP